MDVLSDLLHRARAGDTRVWRLVQRPPWSMSFVDAPLLTVVATLGGTAVVRSRTGEAEPLAAGDVALLTGPEGHTVADSADTPEMYIVHKGRKYGPAGEPAEIGARTYGDGLPGATELLRGLYELDGDAGRRITAMLPAVAVVPAGPRTRATLDQLSAEAASTEPGQEAVLGRLLDLLLAQALRAWCVTEAEAGRKGWYVALLDREVGEALRLLHAAPARGWTVAGLAAEVGMSRASFAARFTRLVGEPPLAYLTGWRMSLAAERLRTSVVPLAAVAREVGYGDAFAFSAAFKRVWGTSPSAWRREGGAWGRPGTRGALA